VGDNMVYTSIENEKIKELKKLNHTKYRNMNNLFLVDGEHLVEEAFKKGLLKELIVLENNDFKLDVDTIYVSENVLNHLSELETPQGVMGVCYKLKPTEIKGNVLILDQIQDPGNLGTMIRSSLAFNIDTIILSPDTVDLYNSKVIRASQGMMFHLNIISADLLIMLDYLKKQDYKIYGTRFEKAKELKNVEKAKKFAIIVGNEGRGVKQEILELCDEYIYIKTNPLCESLNVGVAASIILYELEK
jgi:RNA methyltransferase, TrmH family